MSEPTAAADHARKGAKVRKHYRHALNGYAATLSESQVAAVKADGRVAFVAPDRKRKLDKPKPHTENRPQVFTRPLNRIDAELSSTASGDGKGNVKINVGVIDDGIDDRHAELDLRAEADCVGNDDAEPLDETHGTAVAGLIAATDDKMGVVGVVPGAALWSADVFFDSEQDPFGTDAQFLCGLDFMASTRTDRDKSNDIAVLNSSNSYDAGAMRVDDGNCGLSNNDAVHLAYCRLTGLGITIVNAAGNDDLDFQCCGLPAYDEVLTVAWTPPSLTAQAA